MESITKFHNQATFVAIVFVAWAGVAVTTARAEGPGGPGDFPPPHHGPKLSDAQRKVLDDCLKANNITPPKHDAGEQEIFDECRSDSEGDREAFKSCLAENGIAPPPKPSDADRKAFKACLDKAKASSAN